MPEPYLVHQAAWIADPNAINSVDILSLRSAEWVADTNVQITGLDQRLVTGVVANTGDAPADIAIQISFAQPTTVRSRVALRLSSPSS